MTSSQQPRRTLLVDREYQLRFITRLAMMVFGVAGTSSLIAMAILWRAMDQPELTGHMYVAAALVGSGLTLLLELVIALPITYYLGLRQTHKVVGPIPRMIRMLQAIGAGDFSQRIRLRPGDALVDVATAINQMTENLQKRYGKPT
ncbi:MAG: HAMP domain-containing protein [Candidatus Omnitrophica bacterium]|nr:HAMP domain-containing protein [Candidatus Omnitrophota bacterium]